MWHSCGKFPAGGVARNENRKIRRDDAESGAVRLPTSSSTSIDALTLELDCFCSGPRRCIEVASVCDFLQSHFSRSTTASRPSVRPPCCRLATTSMAMQQAKDLEQQAEKSLDKLEDQIVRGDIDSTETKARYLGES